MGPIDVSVNLILKDAKNNNKYRHINSARVGNIANVSYRHNILNWVSSYSIRRCNNRLY